ncbi:unnamed protein product, partial [Ixodes persulcatus]
SNAVVASRRVLVHRGLLPAGAPYRDAVRNRALEVVRKHPIVLEDLLQGGACRWRQRQAPADQVFAHERELPAEVDLGTEDLLVALEGDVPAHHVVEEDAKGPDCGRTAVVTAALDPFRGTVDAGAVKVCVEPVAEVVTGPEVDEVHGERLEVHENVLVLDVAVDDYGFVTGQHALNDLLEEEPGQRLFEHALLGDVVEQVLDGLWPLHDEDKGIGPLVPVEETNDAGYVGHLEQQVDLEGHPLTVQRGPFGHLLSRDVLDGDRQIVSVLRSSVDGTEATLSQKCSDPVVLLEGVGLL